MADKVLEILAPEVNVPKLLREHDDGRGGTLYQNQDVIRFKGDRVPLSEVSPEIVNVLNDKDDPRHEAMSKRVKLVSGEPEENVAVRLGLPFEGYDDMDEEEIVSALRVLPSPTVEAIKRYESQHENRPKIVQYMTGFGVSPGDYEEDHVGSEVQEGAQEGKPTSRLKTRRVTDDHVELGEGFTGSPGHPQIPYGSEAEGEEEKKSSKTRRRKSGSSTKKSSGSSSRRRSRRSRSTSSSSSSSGEGSGSSESGSGEKSE